MTTNGEAGGGAATRCLIADDQAMVREGFAAVLDSQPGLLVVGQAADGADAVRQARSLEPHVVLMDVRMPVMDGLEATRQILGAATGPVRPRVLMLTTFDLDEYVYEALRAGASGFLLKDATAAELIHAVRVVAAGGSSPNRPPRPMSAASWPSSTSATAHRPLSSPTKPALSHPAGQAPHGVRRTGKRPAGLAANCLCVAGPGA